MLKKTFRYSALLLILLVSACNSVKDDPTPIGNELTEAQQYFLSIAFGTEFGGASPVIRKWATEVKIFMADSSHQELNQELNLVINELNDLIETISIRRVNTRAESNLVLYCGNADTFVRDYEPATQNVIKNNFGLFWVYWNNQQELIRGNVFVDTQRTQGVSCLRHLLREELTQSLGIMQDSGQFTDSIFQQRWTCTTTYAAVDTMVIKLLYHPLVKPGMSKQQVTAIIKKL
ncbi:DUF2927 domain-containing protein [Haliscomenobacter hydrossis]|uniref:DUF2927 domain-containing protein n=1 Tax=Haliscomenobacter hydrossis (strain ATCC 27775 / DSM 1100 / LMG 10767 / O) TaxID=760192 RepID=F4KUY3_HALH1|nr:DUF2927 domain-containing protein [Haliscomenobacter hydrossis]AEE48159.1 hypothetical protein Halhy_0247 [Haliscomenobacter hydrossis DSM 1100]